MLQSLEESLEWTKIIIYWSESRYIFRINCEISTISI